MCVCLSLSLPPSLSLSLMEHMLPTVWKTVPWAKLDYLPSRGLRSTRADKLLTQMHPQFTSKLLLSKHINEFLQKFFIPITNVLDTSKN